LASQTTSQPAIYDPNLTTAEIEQMEMECVTAHRGTPIPTSICHLQTFYRRMDTEIGACDGKKTAYIVVKYNSTGDVHGYPITVERLRGLGAQI
jgi:hypothetical protein